MRNDPARLRLRHTAALSGLLAFAGCQRDDPAQEPARPPGLLLELDGLQVLDSDLAPLLAYAESVDRRLGRDTLRMNLLTDHVIPLKLAQRAFAAEREVQRERAAALARVVGNGGYPELVAKGKAVARDWNDRPHLRHELPIPVAAWAFDEQRIGQVSPLLETPQGFSLVSSFLIERGTTRALDRAEAFQVAFYTHDANAFASWLEGERARIADKVAWVHPEWRNALPPWLKAP